MPSSSTAGGSQFRSILGKGVSRSDGPAALTGNVVAARIMVELVRPCLGPKGSDKVIIDRVGDIVITNSAAKMLETMAFTHPAAKIVAETAKAMDKEVGDGSTTVVLLTGILLEKARNLAEKGIHPTLIAEGYTRAARRSLQALERIARQIRPGEPEMLRAVAKTAMAGKVVSGASNLLGRVVGEAILTIAEAAHPNFTVNLDNIKIHRKRGGSIEDTTLIRGLTLDKLDVDRKVLAEMPKRVVGAKIAVIGVALDAGKTSIDSQYHVNKTGGLGALLKHRHNQIRSLAKRIMATGANVVFCRRDIHELAEYYFGEHGVLALSKIKTADVDRLLEATGASLIIDLDAIDPAACGFAKLVEIRKIAGEEVTIVDECMNPKAVTIFLRGGTEYFLAEAERAVRNALWACKHVMEEPRVTVAGGAVEIEASRELHRFAGEVEAKSRLAVEAFAEALESIPAVLAENAGMDPLDAVARLRSAHSRGEVSAGIDAETRSVADLAKLGAYEPIRVKRQVVKSAAEAACLILKIDEVIAAPLSDKSVAPKQPAAKREDEE